MPISADDAVYLSPDIQNELILLLGNAVRDEIIKRVQNAEMFVVMMDETQDFANVDQVIIMLRFVSFDGRAPVIEERMIALEVAESKTGEALEDLLLKYLEALGLNLLCVIGQSYDGGANLAGAFQGVQARIFERNNLATFVHCFAHSLNRALVNSVNNKKIAEARNFFGILEHLKVFIGRSAHLQAFFLKGQGQEGSTQHKKDHRGEEKQKDKQQLPASASVPKPKRPGRSMSDTRWGSRSSSMNR